MSADKPFTRENLDSYLREMQRNSERRMEAECWLKLY